MPPIPLLLSAGEASGDMYAARLATALKQRLNVAIFGMGGPQMRAAGVEISALAIPQCCISDAVAQVVRDVGATRVLVARSPDESGLFEALDRAVAALSR